MTNSHVAIISPCMGRYGGLEAFTLAVATAIEKDPTFSVEVVFKKVSSFSLHDDLRQMVRASGLRVSFCRRFSSQLWRVIRRSDLIHLQNLSPDVAVMTRLAAKPLLATIHARNQGNSSLRQRLWKATLNLPHQRFYISDFVRKSWEQAEQPWPCSRVVHSVCELSTLSPLPIKQRRGFVFVSRWIDNKGLDTLVEAYAQSGLDPDSWPLKLLGDGPLRPKIIARLNALGLNGKVDTPGFLSPIDKAQYIRQSRFAVIPPNLSEDFGLVPLEARHLGLPCIITRDGGVPESAGVHSLSCEPGDIEGLKKLLLQAAEMTEEDYRALSTAAHESLDSEIVRPEAYVAFYEEMLGS
jgi:glycosyltransferase involved in cell wall biosynthesis